MSGTSADRDCAFISYGHADGRLWLERLLVFLKPYKKRGHLQVWADPYIDVGSRWEREIERAIGRERVGVLLASPGFASSDFILDVELPALRRAADLGHLTLFCVPVSAVNAKILELDMYQWVRPPDQPLDLLGKAECNGALN